MATNAEIADKYISVSKMAHILNNYGTQYATKDELDLIFKTSSILAENSWDHISKVIKAGLGPALWKVGDTKPVPLNGVIGNTSFNCTIDAVLLGFDHNFEHEFISGSGDHIADFALCSKDGELCGIKDNNYYKNSEDGFNISASSEGYEIGSYPETYMHTTLFGNYNLYTAISSPIANSLMAALPQDLRRNMVKKKKWCVGADYDDRYEYINIGVSQFNTYITLPSYIEIAGEWTDNSGNFWGASSSGSIEYDKRIINYAKRYDYFKNIGTNGTTYPSSSNYFVSISGLMDCNGSIDTNNKQIWTRDLQIGITKMLHKQRIQDGDTSQSPAMFDVFENGTLYANSPLCSEGIMPLFFI